MKVFSVHWKGEGKGGLVGFVVVENEDSAFEKVANYLGGEIKHTKDEVPQKYIQTKSSVAYFIKEEDGWVLYPTSYPTHIQFEE